MATRGQKLLAAGTAVLVAEPLLALAHTGGVGAIVGLAVGAIAYNAVEDLERAAGREISLPVPTTRAAGNESFAYRLLNGKSTRDARQEINSNQADQQEWDDEDEFDHEGAFTFSQLLATGWRPSYEQIFLARLEDGTNVFITVEQAVHIALAGSTRQGKTSIIRQLLAQLSYVGCTCILLDPHYTPYDVDIDEDWTPFTPYLRYDPLECKSYARMEQILRQTATKVLDKRKLRREQSQPVGKPIVIVIDEYPAVLAEMPVIQNYVAKLLREGGKYRIILVVASQDFQVKTVSPKAGGAIRDCYKTCFYVGGDATTANVLLDGPVSPDIETTLGKGPVMLRCATLKKAGLAQTPFMDNEALYQLLGPSTYLPQEETQEEEEEEEGMLEAETEEEEEEEEQSFDPLPEVIKRDQRRKAEDIDIKIAIALWNSGCNSRAKLAKALDIAENQAGKLMALINVNQSDG
jgi:hypothetical protein